jgi:hypothetical protein
MQENEIVTVVPETAESIPDSGLSLPVTVRFRDVASKNSIPFLVYSQPPVSVQQQESFELTFLAKPYPVMLGFNEYAVETNIGPLLVLVAKDEFGSSSARAEAVAKNLNDAVEIFQKNSTAKVSLVRQPEGISLYAEDDSGQQRLLLRAFPEDALAYGKISQRVVKPEDLADWWQMLLLSYYRVFVQFQSPEDTGIVGAGGGILRQIYDFYSMSNAQGQKYYRKDFLETLPADQKTRLVALSLSLPARVSSVEGAWVGTMSNILYDNVSQASLELILQFRQSGSGTLTGTAELNWKIVVGSGIAYRGLGKFPLQGSFRREKAVPLEFSFVEKENRRLNFVGKLEGGNLSGKFVATAVAEEGSWSARPR